MDKMKGLAKGGWKPAGDRKISRDTWKSDLKGIATGKRQDPYAYARDHQSAPLSALKDPASFAPPPKHRDYYPNGATPAITSSPQTSSPARTTAPQGPQGGWGSAVPSPSRRREQEEAEEEAKAKLPPVPYRVDTSGLRTDNLPKPPVRRIDGSGVSTSGMSSQPSTPIRNGPAVPLRQNNKPPPGLPPRQNEYPDEFTPAPPPPYTTNPDAGILNPTAINNLSRAGISVPGLGMGNESVGQKAPTIPQISQVNELQQRFARLNTGPSTSAVSSVGNASIQAIAAAKKPPPAPPKKSGLADTARNYVDLAPVPPPLPMGSKPRPM